MSQTKIITIWSPTAGIGTSLTAINLAKAMGKKGLNVALYDFDLKTPSLNIYLDNHDVVHSLDNVMPYIAGNLTPQVILNNIQEVEGFKYLRGTNTPDQAQYISIESLTAILEVSKEIFDYIIIDTNSVIDNAGTFVALEMADLTFLLTERNAITIQQYERARGLLVQNFDMNKIKLIINKCHKDVLMEEGDIQAFYDIHSSKEIPLLDSEFVNSINKGKWLTYLYEGKKNTQSYIKAIEDIISDDIIDGFKEMKEVKKKSFSIFKKQ